MTYDELLTNIRNYTEVDANVFTNSVCNTFILMAENRILRDIDLDVFKLEVTGNMTSGNKFLSTPSDILTHRYVMMTKDSEQIFLEFRDTSFMKEYWRHNWHSTFLFRLGSKYFLHSPYSRSKLHGRTRLHT